MKIIDTFIASISKSEKSKKYLFKSLKSVLGGHEYVLLDFSDPENPQMTELMAHPDVITAAVKDYYVRQNLALENAVIALKDKVNSLQNTILTQVTQIDLIDQN